MTICKDELRKKVFRAAKEEIIKILIDRDLEPPEIGSIVGMVLAELLLSAEMSKGMFASFISTCGLAIAAGTKAEAIEEM